MRDAGLDYGWHNHDFEMADLGGGARPLDLILQADEGLSLEFDVGLGGPGRAGPARVDRPLWAADHGRACQGHRAL
jgi:hypothetical protein